MSSAGVSVFCLSMASSTRLSMVEHTEGHKLNNTLHLASSDERISGKPGRVYWVFAHAAVLGGAKGTRAGSAEPHQRWRLPIPPGKQHSS